MLWYYLCRHSVEADLNYSIVGAETAEFSRLFQVLMVIGRNEYKKARISLLIRLYLEGFVLVGRVSLEHKEES